jgi:hypothetical protein
MPAAEPITQSSPSVEVERPRAREPRRDERCGIGRSSRQRGNAPFDPMPSPLADPGCRRADYPESSGHDTCVRSNRMEAATTTMMMTTMTTMIMIGSIEHTSPNCSYQPHSGMIQSAAWRDTNRSSDPSAPTLPFCAQICARAQADCWVDWLVTEATMQMETSASL